MPHFRQTLRSLHRAPEPECVERLLTEGALSSSERGEAGRQARSWIEAVRAEKSRIGGMADFMQEFGLSTQEGIALMCVAEALLRIPDAPTADDLIQDKLGAVDWSRHVAKTDTMFMNASVWGLMLTGKLMEWSLKPALAGLVGRASQPVIRVAIARAMAMLGDRFVLGRTIGEALEEGARLSKAGYTCSYDMLGEGARTHKDAERYFENYRAAIAAIGAEGAGGDIASAPGISVKLSALHPRFAENQREICFKPLVEKLVVLCEAATKAGIGLTVDAEESERLEITLDIIHALLKHPVTQNWAGLGLAVQAYQKRATAVVDEVIESCRTHQRRMMVRLVKGAYWDSEIKRTQMGGFSDYPVFTRKVTTDVSYFACAKKLLGATDIIYPAFGSHNAYTLAALINLAPQGAKFEVQRLHGMGEALHEQVIKAGVRSRIYAPVGAHADLLAYLVRRILENGANSSFVHQVQDSDVPIAALVHDPAEELRDYTSKRNAAIPLPADLFWEQARRNSAGVDLDAPPERDTFLAEVTHATQAWRPTSLVAGQPAEGDVVEPALQAALAAQPLWAAESPARRAEVLDKAAELFEAHRAELAARLVAEAGRCVKNAVAEVREAVDLCRYYAAEARRTLNPQHLHGYTGEANTLALYPRGVIAAISPWNFPLAIFVGQIAAALVTGNAVVAKPAEQTPAIAYRAVQLLHSAGVPPAVLALLLGRGEEVGAALVNDRRINGVVFTGSTEVGRAINVALANRPGPVTPLIAETGGLNALVVDSTALPEQVADDVLVSAFDSAGQRCSSLRLLLVQEDVADKMLEMIIGATKALVVGNPMDLATDLGPLIDAEAKQNLIAHIERMKREGKLLYAGEAPAAGHFVAPHIFEIPTVKLLQREAFGPVLHVVRWSRENLPELLSDLRSLGYGLTGGVHSRRAGFVREVAAQMPVGNLYVNRNLVGAIPGVQPFGGEGLSGTGPKAGGPQYLARFCTERHTSTDTTAAGGNASLLMLGR
jgi:RHH-type transcriptional regulator, proline utilization regulon repressor / proline dehydrogenase / delta 1-pyrroline-5-carboxylate dehydrogenase